MNKIKSVFSSFHIHPLLWFVFFLGIITGSFTEILIVFSLIFIHEMGHYVMALFFRWKIKQVMFWPFGGVMETDEYYNRPYKEEFLVVISGPMQHIWIHIVLLYFLQNNMFTPYLLEYALTYNLTLLCFNLLPIYPLDGGKLLLLLLSYPFPFQRVIHYTIVISSFSILIGLCMVYLYDRLTFHTFLLASFLLIENRLEWKQRQYVFLRHLLARYQNQSVKGKLEKLITVSPSTPVYDIVRVFRKGYFHRIHVKKNNLKHVEINETHCLTVFFEWKKPYEKVDVVAEAVNP